MSPSTIAPTLIGGRYTVERELGYGATATVYLCRDRETGTHVAVKVLRVELAESVGAERFLREIRVTAGLQHENIVSVLDSGADGSILYCVLPYLEGGTLRDVLRETKQLAINDAVQIGRTIAGALEYAHGKGLIHRDIKPENILFSGGKAFLGDFGIARLLYATQSDLKTTTGVVRGTPAYMSPEQASGERDYDGRSDIYSLACVVYEMVSGMPPFVGPTSQSVLAQRFSSRPRPMSVYRNTVTPDLEQVIDKALATSPADRYATAKEFSDNLEAAGHATSASVAKSKKRVRAGMIGAVAAAVFIAASLIAMKVRNPAFAVADIVPDTTQLVVIPFNKEGDTKALGSIDALVYSAFSAWRGITVLEPYRVRDAVLKKQSASGVYDPKAVAISLGAGRFVRGEVGVNPAGGWIIQVWLYQVDRDKPLKDYSVKVSPEALARIDAVYATLARTLLLQGKADSSESVIPSTTSLPAMQSFAGGIEALDEWDFPLADALFQRAVEEDRQYARAYLWQAQIRAWQRQDTSAWLPLARRAVADSARLPVRDQQLAAALVLLGGGKFEQACSRYESLKTRNASDFAAWFGMGQCRELDHRIERDETSPTKWSYRSSYSDAIAHYRTAFEVLSLSHRSMERGAFEPLRDLLFMKPSKLQVAEPPPGDSSLHFVGRLDWAGDRPVLRPVLVSLLRAGSPDAVPPGMRTAIQSQQRLFGSIASAWSTALPRSAGAKEAVVVALEMRGDRSALDTLIAARGLATESDAKLRLATAEAVIRLKFADPADLAELNRIRALADSLLAAHPTPSNRESSYLAALAAMTGRCARAGDLVLQSPYSTWRRAPRDVIGSADALTTKLIIGCAVNPGAEVKRISQRLATTPDPAQAINGLLTRAVQMTEGADPATTSAFSASAGTYLLRAQQAATLGHRDAVTAIFNRLSKARARTGYDDIGPDAIYLESRVFLSVGDTAAAIAALDRLLERLPYLTPGMLAKPVEMGGLMRAMELRGAIGSARRDADGARWGIGYKALWSSADKGLIKAHR